jgi:tetraprenyl-beta-curcumene synthase
LHLLVTYQIMWDFLDCVSERDTDAGQKNGLQLHLALVEALDPGRPISDYYLYHSSRKDGGYLHSLVQACRQSVRELPAIAEIRPLLLREAGRANVQAINHDTDPARREAALRNWVRREFPYDQEIEWFEFAAAAGAGLAIYALFVLASGPIHTSEEVERVYQAYFPWVGALATMLDSYVDEIEDSVDESHRYVAYYLTPELATERIGELARRCLKEVRGLESSEYHTLIVACMIAMYLSKDSARSPATRARTRRLVDAGGSLARTLLPILRVWRFAYGQRSS